MVGGGYWVIPRLTLIMKLSSLLLSLFATTGSTSSLPYKLPFHTGRGTSILSGDGKKVQLVGTNWPGHQEVMIPEGLQYSSVKGIVSKIRGLNLNVVRLTFAIEMVDDIFENHSDTDLETTVINALGGENGTVILNDILHYNPQFSKKTTRLQVFDAVAKEMASQGIYVHLDNHMSKATWCCGTGDGNAWWGDTDFNTTNWLRGWKFMASHAAKHWESFSSVGLRNELRQPDAGRGEPYDWFTWYTHMTAGALAVHSVAPEALKFFSGFNYDTTLSPIPLGLPLNGTAGTSTDGKVAYFNPSHYPYADKIVLELHKYDFEHTQISCADFGNVLYHTGYSTLNRTDPAVKYNFPVLLTEWGFAQDGVYWNSTTYNKCLIEFMNKWKPSGWMQWELSGSFYTQTRVRVPPTIQDMDEGWGLLNHNWTAIRSPLTVANSLEKMIEATLSH